jgi:ABC-type transporter Mla MlaB component
MTFRITSTTGDDGDVLLIAGGLVGEGLDEVDRAVNAANRPLTIDVGDLQHADTAALCLLARLEADGVQLTRVSQYLRLLLGQVAKDGAAA